MSTDVRCVQDVAATFALAALLFVVTAAVLTSLWLRYVLPAPRKVVSWNVVAFSSWRVIVVRHGASGVLQGFIGFFHPFADSGGGGERVLW